MDEQPVPSDEPELASTRRALAAAEARFRDLTELSPDLIARHDLEGRFTFASSALKRLLGLEPDLVLGRLTTDFVVPEDIAAFRAFFDALLKGEAPPPAKFRMHHAQGGVVWLEARGTRVHGPEGAPAEVVLLSRDITDLKALEAILEQEGTRDELTGLHNRRYLMERLEPALRSARRYGHPLSFCLCDLDRFKEVNEAHGRAAGDEILKAFGLIARKELRSEDLAARYGGDEFAFLFPFITAQDAAVSLERIRERLRSKDFCGHSEELFRVSATFGVANLDPAHARPEDLFEAADRVLFHAKELGRDRVLVEG
ncbi:MAG: GGDEF domain-containing protein [Holophagaceae bacterium]|nr:GGDEF domain-containing protein [Holophagaceae bacterium]